MGMLSKINHVVVLMLENRSFDNMFGRLYPKSDGFDGLSGTEACVGPDGVSIPVWNEPGTDEETMRIPNPDPGELWFDINTQIFGSAQPGTPLPDASMAGFAKNYANQTVPPSDPCVAKNIMHYFSPEQVPVISRLARQFAVCDRWHASAPCQTWPNRFFVHTGTANGFQNNDPIHFPYEMPTIFNRFEDLRIANGWKIYFHDMPQSLTLSRLWPHAENFRLYGEFRHDAKNGTLPAYSFIEPRYFADVALPNDEHPPHVVTLGEQLIADVYNSLRGGPKWTETLFIITYDEHGGCYDHVPPPVAVPPSPTATLPFNFDRYGVRVPAVVISPYIQQGAVLRPPGKIPFDHTSIIATLRKRFSLGPQLSERDAVAPDLDVVLTLPNPSNLGPEHLDALPFLPTPADIARAQARPLNDMQRALVKLASHLPATETEGDFQSFIATHIAAMRADTEAFAGEAERWAQKADADLTSNDSVALIKTRLGILFRSLPS